MVRKSTEEARNCDNGIKTAIQWIGERERLVQNNLADRSQTVLSLWAQWDRLAVRDRLLYQKMGIARRTKDDLTIGYSATPDARSSPRSAQCTICWTFWLPQNPPTSKTAILLARNEQRRRRVVQTM
jgi:hypothetical protein